MLRTWTVYPDYGGMPLIWELEGIAKDTFLGSLSLHADETLDFMPDSLSTAFQEWAQVWESSKPENIDWQSFHKEGLRLSALLALWTADANILVRYSIAFEDSRFGRGGGPDMWMTPTNVAQYANKLPVLLEDTSAWMALDRLYRDLEGIDSSL